MNSRQELIDAIGEAMMGFRGYQKGQYPLEWDPDNKDSQLSMVLEDVEFVVDELIKHGKLNLNTATFKIPNTYSSYVHTVTVSPPSAAATTTMSTPPPRDSAVTTSVGIEISSGHNPTIADLLDFSERLQRLNVDPETPLHGHLRFMLELEDTFVDRIDCGECGVEDFLVYSEEHPCND